MNFDDAWQYCEDHEAYLILVKDPAENIEVAKFLRYYAFGDQLAWLSYRYLKGGTILLLSFQVKHVLLLSANSGWQWKGAYPPAWKDYTFTNFENPVVEPEHYCAATKVVDESYWLGKWERITCGTKLNFGCMKEKIGR